MLAFDEQVQLPTDSCYHSQLALATKANKDTLKHWVTVLPHRSPYGANYSRAFQRAFELFSATSNSSESTSRKKGKRTKFIFDMYVLYCLLSHTATKVGILSAAAVYLSVCPMS